MSLTVKPDKKSVYSYDSGPRYFGVGREVNNEVLFSFIDTCRETFLRSLSKNLTNKWVLYYSPSKPAAKNIKKFIEECEKRLIKNKYQRSQIHAVGMKVCILPAEFWKDKFRLGLLTILIRAGLKFGETKNFSQCINSSTYLKSEGMMAAVKAFFEGNTVFKGNGRGNHMAAEGFWLDTFEHLSEKETIAKLGKE